MIRRSPLLAMLAVCQLATISRGAEIDPAGQKSAREFWAAVAKPDTEQMARFYAPKVLLKAGSELLKREWGVNPEGDRDKDLLLDRDRLLEGYRRMIEKVTAAKWSRVFSKIQPDAISITAVQTADRPLTGARQGDLLLKVVIGKGGDALMFLFRCNDQGQWQVVAEQTDY